MLFAQKGQDTRPPPPPTIWRSIKVTDSAGPSPWRPGVFVRARQPALVIPDNVKCPSSYPQPFAAAAAAPAPTPLITDPARTPRAAVPRPPGGLCPLHPAARHTPASAPARRPLHRPRRRPSATVVDSFVRAGRRAIEFFLG